jgi:hypothetical protein
MLNADMASNEAFKISIAFHRKWKKCKKLVECRLLEIQKTSKNLLTNYKKDKNIKI